MKQKEQELVKILDDACCYLKTNTNLEEFKVIDFVHTFARKLTLYLNGGN